MKRRTRWSYSLSPRLARLGVLLTVCSACGPHRAQIAGGTVQCGGEALVFNDPVIPLVQDSVTAGGPAAVAQFYWTALAAPVVHGTWGTEDRHVVATMDSLGRARLSVPQAGRYALRARVIGSVFRLDSLVIPPDSTLWVRIGLARASLSPACVTVASTERPE